MANLYISGITGSIDTGKIVDALIEIKQQPLRAVTQKKALLQANVSSLTNLYGSLNKMQSFFSGLDVKSIFSTKKVTSSDEGVLQATVTKDTPEIMMNIKVEKVAQTEIRATMKGLSFPEDKFSSGGTLTLKYWKDDSEFVSYNINYLAGQTLNELVNSINSAQNYVKASVYYTGIDYRLLLTESDPLNSKKETGASSYVIEADGLPQELVGVDAPLQNAQNASITIGASKTSVISPSNKFTAVLPGLDITVKKEGSVSLTVSDDYSKIDSILNEFVKYYNSVISLVNSMTGKGAQFQGDSTVTTIKTGFSNLLNPPINQGLINYSDIDGTISINTEALENLKSSNPSKLEDTLTTLKSSFSTALNNYISSISTYKNINNAQINTIDETVSSMQEYLVNYEKRLRQEYAKLEAFISQMNQITTRIQDFITTLSEMTKRGNR